MLLEGGVDGKAFLQQLHSMHFTSVEETDFMTRFEKKSVTALLRFVSCSIRPVSPLSLTTRNGAVQ
jgi:hypothetical protein